MEKQFVNCMLFVTFVIIILYIVFNPFSFGPEIPFVIYRSIKIVNEDISIDNLTFNSVPANVYQFYDKNLDSINPNLFYNNIEINPEFNFYFFKNIDARYFIETHFDNSLLNIYDKLHYNQQKNLWKYCILYNNGGIFMENNLINNVPLVNVINDSNSIILSKEENKVSGKFIIAVPQLKIFKDLIDSYRGNKILTLNDLVSKYNYNKNIILYDDGIHITNINNKQEIFKYE